MLYFVLIGSWSERQLYAIVLRRVMPCRVLTGAEIVVTKCNMSFAQMKCFIVPIVKCAATRCPCCPISPQQCFLSVLYLSLLVADKIL